MPCGGLPEQPGQGPGTNSKEGQYVKPTGGTRLVPGGGNGDVEMGSGKVEVKRLYEISARHPTAALFGAAVRNCPTVWRSIAFVIGFGR